MIRDAGTSCMNKPPLESERSSKAFFDAAHTGRCEDFGLRVTSNDVEYPNDAAKESDSYNDGHDRSGCVFHPARIRTRTFRESSRTPAGC